MKGVDTIARVRREYFVRGRSIKEIVRELHVSRNTVRKIIRSDETAFEYERSVQPQPKIGAWREDLDRLLATNAARSRREQLTLLRVFEELRGLGYGGGYDAVRRYAAAWGRRQSAATAAAFVPLSFAPGEAYQFDWSHEVVLIDGVTTVAKVAHVRLCHSRMLFVRAYPRESQEIARCAHNAPNDGARLAHCRWSWRLPGSTWSANLAPMCNLYSMMRPQDAVRSFFPRNPPADRTGNMPPLPGIFPDYSAPIVRNGSEGRELVMARWGMPTPPRYLVGRKVDPGVTNIRQVGSPHWQPWLGPDHRCVVPFTSFSENEHLPDGTKPPVWFALDENRPLAFFAGIWTRWTSVRKLKEGEVIAELFGFLTTDANGTVGAIHPKAMPAILTTESEVECWLSAPIEEALRLQRPLPDDRLAIVARGEKEDALVAKPFD